VWDFWNPVRNKDGLREVVYRMRRVSPDFLAQPGFGNKTT